MKRVRTFTFLILLTLSFCIVVTSQNREIRYTILYYDWVYLDGLLSRNFIEKEPSINIKKDSNLNFDYDWLNEEGPIFIAHRGGNYLKTGQNTKTTIERSLNSDIEFIEIDFYLDDEKKISCLTDPEFFFDICSIEWLFKKIIEKDFYLIIDLKINVHDEDLYRYFYNSLKEINGFEEVKNKIIPQSYNLNNINTLFRLGYDLGPIFTTYRSNVPIDLLYKKVKRFELEAMAVPYGNIEFIIRASDKDISYFLFPIKDLNQLEVAFDAKVKGIYSPFEEFKDLFVKLIKEN
ncbi:hypothetical protein N8791_00440 [Gammaproteobacteria bacterium]|nr:hypothetical protein [Gammaproteobacteria bacterium]